MHNEQTPNHDDLPRLPPAESSGRMLVERQTGTALAQPLPWRAQNDDDDDIIDLRQLWHVIVKRKWTVFTFTLIVVVSVMTAAFLMTPIYRASLTLQIDRQEARVVEYQSVTPTDAAASESREFYQTQYELLKSRSLAQQVIDQLNLVEHPIFNPTSNPDEVSLHGALTEWIRDLLGSKDAAALALAESEPQDPVQRLVKGFLENLTVEPVRNSKLVKIHYESPDPALAMRIVNAISTNFINLTLSRRMDAASYATNFLQERLQQTKAKLEDSERALVEFARSSNIVRDNESGQADSDSQVMQAFTVALTKAQEDRIAAEALYKQMQNGNASGLPMVMESKVIQEFKQTQAKLEAEYQDKLQVFKPGYGRMQQLRGQINEMEAKANQEIANIKTSIRIAYETALKREETLKAKLEEARQNVLGVQTRGIQYNILKREVDTNRQLYDGLLQRYKEVGIAGGVGINNVSVVDPAELPRVPAKPNKPLFALIAIALGLFGGIALVFLFEQLDDTIKGSESLEQLTGLPVLGIVPLIAHKDKTQTETLVMAQLAETRLAFSEAYRSLRTTLQFSTAAGMPKVLMVTSTSMGEGKTTTALSLAVTMAQTGSKVLLIDADLRKASLHRKLSIDNSRGLTNHLAGDMGLIDITHQTQHANLFVIPSGPLPPNPAELLGGAKMTALLNLAKTRFQCVLIDAPPVLGLADAPLLGSIVDSVALVVEAGVTRKGYLFGAIKRLAATRSPIIGAVLTKFDARSGSYGSYGYSYYHSNYYQYGGQIADATTATADKTLVKA